MSSSVGDLGISGTTDELNARDRAAARQVELDGAPERRVAELAAAWRSANPGRSEGEWDQVREKIVEQDQVSRTLAHDRQAREGNARLVREAF